MYIRARDLVRFKGSVELILRAPQQCKLVSAGIARAARAGWHGPTALVFWDCELGEDGAMQLSDLLYTCPRLTILDLSGAYIGPTGAGFVAKPLAVLTDLTFLKLSYNELEATGVRRLTGALGSRLTLLDLGSNDMGPAGSKRIASSLVSCPLLTHLSVADNCLGPRGLAPLIELVAGATRLEYFDASDNELSGEAIAALCRRMQERERGAREMVELAARLERLEALVSARGERAVGAGSTRDSVERPGKVLQKDALYCPSSLVHFKVAYNLIRDLGCTHLATVLPSLVALKTLDLRMNYITHVCMCVCMYVHVCVCERERARERVCLCLCLYLCLRLCGQAGAVALSGCFSSLVSLEELDLAFNEIGPGGAAALCRALVSATGN
jgi:Ran GTPase-activating protein (RanGAP) involved in mRNA processing and transport